MHGYRSRIREARLDPDVQAQVRLDCPAGAIPAPGQFTLAYDPQEPAAALATPLFAAELLEDGFWAAAPLPAGWQPGGELALRGPLGKGFALPPATRRLALAALGDSAARLLPLAQQATRREVAGVLFSDAALPRLPVSIEVHPLSVLPEALAWADFLALDLPAGQAESLPQALGLRSGLPLACPGQALLTAAMPCGGLGECGACAIPARRGWKMACQDGPVFDLGTWW
jgi:hypothetical protein